MSLSTQDLVRKGQHQRLTVAEGGTGAVVEPATGDIWSMSAQRLLRTWRAPRVGAPRCSRPGRRPFTPTVPPCCDGLGTCSSSTPTKFRAGLIRSRKCPWQKPPSRRPSQPRRLRGGRADLASFRRAAPVRLTASEHGAPVRPELVGVIAPFNVPLVRPSARSLPPSHWATRSVSQTRHPNRRCAVCRSCGCSKKPAARRGIVLVPGGAQAGASLVADPHVRIILFTGSQRPPQGRRRRRSLYQACPPGTRWKLRADCSA